MDDYYSDNQPRLIHCKFCGKDYAATYKACPFCHTAPNGKKVGSRSGRNSRAGNRVRTNTRGGGYGGARSPLSIIGIILSIVLLVAAVVIVAGALCPFWERHPGHKQLCQYHLLPAGGWIGRARCGQSVQSERGASDCGAGQREPGPDQRHPEQR